MLTWNKTPKPNGDHTWQIEHVGETVAQAGYSNAGQRLGRRGNATDLHYLFVAAGGRKIWFATEQKLRAFVDVMFQSQLRLGDRHQAVLVGVMWAHQIAYTFDRGISCLPLTPIFPGRDEEITGLLLDRSDDHVRSSAPIVRAAAVAAWDELCTCPLADRPFPILQ
jgi:hypothetical protein